MAVTKYSGFPAGLMIKLNILKSKKRSEQLEDFRKRHCQVWTFEQCQKARESLPAFRRLIDVPGLQDMDKLKNAVEAEWREIKNLTE